MSTPATEAPTRLERLGRLGRLGPLGPLAVVVLAGLVLHTYRLTVAELIIIYTILGLGLNVFMGLCGQANFGVSGFAAIGAFGSGLLIVKAGLNPLLALVPTLVGGALLALLLSYMLLRLREMSLAIGTIAVALAIYSFLESVLPLDWGGGSNGLGVPVFTIDGWNPGPRLFYFYAVAWLVAMYVGYRRLERSRIGRAWRAIRMDEAAAAAAGIDCQGYKRLAFVLNSVVAVLAGTLLVEQNGFASADSFGIFSNLTILLIVIIGGEGSAPGTVIGAAVLVILNQVTSGISTGPIFIYGAVLFVIIRFLPRGLWYYVGYWWTQGIGRVVPSLRVPATSSGPAPRAEPGLRTLFGLEPAVRRGTRPGPERVGPR